MKAPRMMGHPIHPITTHLPIGILLLSVACDVGALLTSQSVWSERALFLLIAGLLSSIPTVLAGMLELLGFSADSPSLPTLGMHVVSAMLSLSAFGVSLAVRLTAGEVTLAAYMASGFGVLALLLTGRFGGDLVFKYGHGVAEASSPSNKSETMESNTTQPVVEQPVVKQSVVKQSALTHRAEEAE